MTATRPRTPRYRRHVTPQLTTRFVGPGQIVALCGVIAVLAVLLFPKEFINQQLHTGAPPHAATIAYLQLLLRGQPSDRTIRLELVREHLRAGQLEDAEAALAPLINHAGPATPPVAALWLSLRRAQFVAIAPGSPRREQARADYARALDQLGSRLTLADQLAETRHAIAAGLYDTAARMAERLLAATTPARRNPGHRSQPGHATAALEFAPAPTGAPPPIGTSHNLVTGMERLVGLVWASRLAGVRPTDSVAPNKALTLTDIHEQAFDALLQSHLAAGKPQDALRAAQAQLPALDPTRVDWTRLMQIAAWADQPSAEADFAQRWLTSAHDDTTRWAAFQALIQAYLSAGQPRQALAAAAANLDRMPGTTALWRSMTRLAMQAGDSAKSVEYARRLVHLGDLRAH